MSIHHQSLEVSPNLSTRRLKALPRGSLGHPNPLGLHPVNQQVSSARRLSAGFSTDGPPSCQPTVCASSLTVSMTPGELPMVYALGPRPARKTTPTSILLPKASTATTFETAIASYSMNEENIPPCRSLNGMRHKHKNSVDTVTAKLRAKSRPRPQATLPKSNTLNVFSNLTASISRTSLAKFNRSTSISSISESDIRTSITPGSSIALPSVDPRQIHTAQPSAYWAGRFMALQDRLYSDMLLPENMTILVTAHAERSIIPEYRFQAPPHMPTSASNPILTRTKTRGMGHRYSKSGASKGSTQLAKCSLEAARLEDDENRACRAFLHLEALCITKEARSSLHAWQQSYARQTGKEELLPRGGAMDGKGWVGRVLGRGSEDIGKRASIAGVVFG